MTAVKSLLLWLLPLVLASMFETPTAWAQEQSVTPLTAKPVAVAPGPANRALKPLEGSFDSVGTVFGGILASDRPELTTAGVHECRFIASELFLVCDIRDTVTSAGQSGTWVGHSIIGWDSATKMYRGVVADSNGPLRVLQGRGDQQKLTLESISSIVSRLPYKSRVTFDFRNTNEIHMTDELRRGKKWVVLGMKVLKPRAQ